MPFPPTPVPVFVALLAALVVAGAAKAVRALSWSGAIAAAVVGFCLFGFGGWPGATALLLFFGTSSALSRLGKRRKAELAFEKGGERDAGQVLANGGVAALCAVALWAFPESRLLAAAALLGALAEANADTWATEIGSLFGRSPRLITTFTKAPPGASGAVSVQGTLAAAAGAGLLAALAPAFGLGWREAMGVMVAGIAGAFVDSLLGATLQVQYRCPACGKLTERRVHCDSHATELARGLSWLNNDAVNALSTLAGAGIGALLYAF